MTASADSLILDQYRKMVTDRYPNMLTAWPVLSGYNVLIGTFGDWAVFIFKHTGNSAMVVTSPIGELQPAQIGVNAITANNVDAVRSKLEKLFNVQLTDGIMFLQNKFMPAHEFNLMLARHEQQMGLSPVKIFLSHKGIDKPRVREFKSTLDLLGFDSWLDEDAMVAGVERDRAILEGFRSSCAAVFFVTKDFADDGFLRQEINYAIDEKRKRGEKFAIIVLKLEGGSVPDLFGSVYIYKQPNSDMEALREILRALPIAPGSVRWR